MSAFAQTTTGDLDISSGNLRVETDVAQCTAWKLSNLFAFFKGEWFRDRRQGVPYFQYVFVSNPNLKLIGDIFKKVCLAAPGVASVKSMQLDYTPRLRNLLATLQVITNTGVVLTGGPGAPFIIDQKTGA